MTRPSFYKHAPSTIHKNTQTHAHWLPFDRPTPGSRLLIVDLVIDWRIEEQPSRHVVRVLVQIQSAFCSREEDPEEFGICGSKAIRLRTMVDPSFWRRHSSKITSKPQVFCIKRSLERSLSQVEPRVSPAARSGQTNRSMLEHYEHSRGFTDLWLIVATMKSTSWSQQEHLVRDSNRHKTIFWPSVCHVSWQIHHQCRQDETL